MDHLGDGEFDVVLHLLDRQVIDADGFMVCKVDDLEVVHEEGRPPRITAILAGPAALLPRFSGGLGQSLLEQWRRLGTQQADRTTPWRLDIDLVTKVDSAVHLSVTRDGLLGKEKGPAPDAMCHRLDHLLGMQVHSGETLLGRVLDVRVGKRDEVLECRHLIVGQGRPGSMLGYDRSPAMGPALVSRLVRWLHRYTGQVAIKDVTGWDWSAEGHGLHVDHARLDELTHAQS